MKKLQLAVLLLIFLPGMLLAQNIETKRVEFPKGSTGTTIKGKIKGDKTIDYVLNAKEGQTLKVKLITKNGANYFNLLAPGEEDAAFYNSSMESNTYEGTLTSSGDHKIRVYLMRSAARRGETANYTLKISITD